MLHLFLIIEVGVVHVVGAVSHETGPHFTLVLIVVCNLEIFHLWPELFNIVDYSLFLGEGSSYVGFLLSDLSLDLLLELVVKQNILSLLKELLSVLLIILSRQVVRHYQL